MCGIAGCVAPREPDLPGRVIQGMTDSLARRGPDDEGVALWPEAALGHRRLAILDLSAAGHQPMLSPDRQTGVVFNGCIYNFLDLRRELEQLGYRFKSHCDTEVLLAGYEHWGVDKLVARLHGMFAFAIWDQRERRLFLVRDRLGVKPLLYSMFSGGIAFASTLAALQAGGFVGSEMDPQAVLEYLEFGFITDGLSIFNGVSKVQPGTIVEWSGGQVSQRSYWRLPDENSNHSISFEDAVEETERRIVESVQRRLIADVPIAALLSGGIDSALVCWALAKLNANVKAYTISVPGEPSDETAHARATALALGIPHETMTVEDGHDDPVDDLSEAFSEPFASQSALGMLRLSRAIKPAATVLLTGDGGDDVFLGYPFFYNCWRAQKLARRMPPFAPSCWRLIRPWLPSGMKRARNFLDYSVGGLGPYNRVRAGLPYFVQRDLFGDRLRKLELPQRTMPPAMKSAQNLLREVLNYHRWTHFAGEFLPKVDGATMYHAIEARSPFLDHTLWEFAAGLPAAIRFEGGRLKAVLREIVRRRIGLEAASRPKQGFDVPAERWLSGRWRGNLEALRGTTLLEHEGWIRRGSLARELDQAILSGNPSQQLWRLVVLERWLQKRRSPMTCGNANRRFAGREMM